MASQGTGDSRVGPKHFTSWTNQSKEPIEDDESIAEMKSYLARGWKIIQVYHFLFLSANISVNEKQNMYFCCSTNYLSLPCLREKKNKK